MQEMRIFEDILGGDMDKEERELIVKAISNAREAIEKTFDEVGWEQGYYEFNIKVYCLGSDFKDVLHIIEDNEHINKESDEND
jgi:hypothetical protein